MKNQTLKRSLLSNAIFSSLSGLTFLLAGQSVADLVGLGAPLIYQIIGAGLLGFAGYVAWTATRPPINTFDALQISAADLLWVVGTILLIGLAYGSLNGLGIIAMLVIAGFVLTFGLWQLKGIGDFYAVPGKEGTHRICVVIDTSEPADNMWEIIADIEEIDAYSPHLTEAILRDGAKPGIGAQRQCTDDKGNVWTEECTVYDHEARQFDVTFLAHEPNFPYPFQTMIGGWQVVPAGSGSTVNIWFEVTPKNRWLHPVILGVMSKDLARNFGGVVARMTGAARGESVSSEGAISHNGISYRLAPC